MSTHGIDGLLVETHNWGKSVAFWKGLGYELPSGFKADIVTISHEHADHNNLGFVSGKPRVIRGLTAEGRPLEGPELSRAQLARAISTD